MDTANILCLEWHGYSCLQQLVYEILTRSTQLFFYALSLKVRIPSGSEHCSLLGEIRQVDF